MRHENWAASHKPITSELMAPIFGSALSGAEHLLPRTVASRRIVISALVLVLGKRGFALAVMTEDNTVGWSHESGNEDGGKG